MELLLRVFLCLLPFIGKSLGDEIELFATEDSDILLPCSPYGKDDLTQQLFDWMKKAGQEVFLYDNGKHYTGGKTTVDNYFKNRVEFFEDQLQFGNASIRIKNTKLNDSGVYVCKFPRFQPEQKFYIKLLVDCILKDRTKDPERKCGTCPKPSFSTLQKGNGGMLVQCEAHGAYPKPEMELHNSADVPVGPVNITILPSGKYFDIILQAVVTEEDKYHCVMKQEGICHQIYSTETLVLQASGSPNTAVVAVSISVVFGVLLLGALGVIVFLLCKNKPVGRRTQGEPIHAQEEHANSVQKDPRTSLLQGNSSTTVQPL